MKLGMSVNLVLAGGNTPFLGGYDNSLKDTTDGT